MVENKSDNGKETLIKATDLPLHGNPFPHKDVVVEETPSQLELKVRSVRLTLQPYLSPVCSAYDRTRQFVSTGVAHSQGAIQSLSENQNTFTNLIVISTSGLVGVVLSGRKGLFRKLLFGSLFMTGASVACYPKDAQDNAKLALYIAKNKLPVLAKEQYEKLISKETSTQEKQSDSSPK